jgi:nucleotide-binding universal stress UspA family protein
MKNILATVDFSDATPAVLEAASSVARALHAKLCLLHVIQPTAPVSEFAMDSSKVWGPSSEELTSKREELSRLADSLHKNAIETTSLVVVGWVVNEILAQAKSCNADMIVLGSHGHGWLTNMVLGSVSSGVLKKATHPVLILPHGMVGPREPAAETTDAIHNK